MFGAGINQDTEEEADKIRQPIARVVATPTADGFKLEIEGRLSEMMQAPNVYPNMRIPRHKSGSFLIAP